MNLDAITDHLDGLIDTAGWTEKFVEWEGPSCAAVCITFEDAEPRVYRLVSGDQFVTLDNVKVYEMVQPEKTGVWHRAMKTEVQPMDVWVVFQNVNEDPYKAPVVTEFQGVFDSREAALAACKTERYLMGRCRLNDAAPHESSVDWLQDVCYPIPDPNCAM